MVKLQRRYNRGQQRAEAQHFNQEQWQLQHTSILKKINQKKITSLGTAFLVLLVAGAVMLAGAAVMLSAPTNISLTEAKAAGGEFVSPQKNGTTSAAKEDKEAPRTAGLSTAQMFLQNDINDTSAVNDTTIRTSTPDNSIEEWIGNLDFGWNSQPPDWLKDLCPEVVDHFTKFPSVKAINPEDIQYLPFLPTDDAARGACTVKVTNALAASINMRIYLHAGSQLGALIHGQGIPWDDDIDGFMELRKKDEFGKICMGEGVEVHSSGVRLQCVLAFNAYKVWLHYPGMPKFVDERKNWYSPYLDLFFYKIEDGRIWEVTPRGRRKRSGLVNYAIEDYFPTRPYYFGGVYVLGPRPLIAESRYNLEVCKLGIFNHRTDKYVRRYQTRFSRVDALDCKRMAKHFPFIDQMNEVIGIEGNPNSMEVYPRRAAEMDSNDIAAYNTTTEERNGWFQEKQDSQGQMLTSALKNLNKVEIDNSISHHKSCTGPLKVVNLNAERGRWWMEAVSLLQDADVIILNEMDIGMARSDQQHTTRLMAHFLGMNYAWGLEFVELTSGNEEDRYNANGVADFNGLHGNAFLTKCAISSPVIFRNEIGSYFSSRPNGVNAKGREKRLGGRMGMFGMIIVDGKETVIGSVHKLSGFTTEVKQYIGERDAIIAGDQEFKYCARVNLENIHSIPVQNTWPASCEKFGRVRGDILCSNMKVIEDEVTTLPCVTKFGFSTSIGDHALITTSLAGN